VRVPPFFAIQCIEGVNHRRGTPPNTIEMSPETWLDLYKNKVPLDKLMGKIQSSGSNIDKFYKIFT
jgi:hypothetical protein